MAPTGIRNDPFSNSNFIVEIDGVPHSSFSSISVLETSSEVIEYREGAEDTTSRKLPGNKKFSNIILRRGATKSTELWQWRKTVLDGKTERRSGSIVALDEARQPVLRINFHEAWPCRWAIGPFDALNPQTLIEEIELVVEGLEFEVS